MVEFTLTDLHKEMRKNKLVSTPLVVKTNVAALIYDFHGELVLFHNGRLSIIATENIDEIAKLIDGEVTKN